MTLFSLNNTFSACLCYLNVTYFRPYLNWKFKLCALLCLHCLHSLIINLCGKKYLARAYPFNLHINLRYSASDQWTCGCYSGKGHPPLHLLMSKSVKNLKQMLLEGAGVGCGMAVQGASRDVELVSWPHMSAAAMHREGERAPDNASVNFKVIVQDLNPLCYGHRRAGRVLLCRGRQPEHKLLCCYLRVICIAAPSWGKEGIDWCDLK